MSKKAIYNTFNNDTEFLDKVYLVYEDHSISCDKIIAKFSENYAKLIGNLIYNNFFYIGHSNSLKNYLTVKQQIDFWEGISEKKYNFEADSFNLKRILNRRIYECSEGQKRRVGLSRLSIDNKKVLLLDEPKTSLDIENVSRLKNYLKDHQKKGGIAIVASHEAFISSNNQDIILTLNPPKNRERDPFI